MSSFLVSNETLGAIARSAYEIKTFGRGMIPGPGGCVGGRVQDRVGDVERAGVRRLAESLYDMNIRALHARYDDRCEELIEPFELKNSQVLGIPELYKAVQCLLYQCSEGLVPKEQLFQDLESWGNALAHWIANEVPVVKAARWS